MNNLVVVKIGGAEGNETDRLCADIAALRAQGKSVVVVHGGSSATTELASQLNVPSQFITSPSGQTSRRTDRATLEVFTRATALLNRRLVEQLRGLGVDAFGMSGLDGGLVQAKRKSTVRSVEGGKTRVIRDEWTGRPIDVRADLFRQFLDAGITCVIAPLACGEGGEMLNVDGDRLAASVAIGLGATDLVLLSNVPGLLRDPDDISTKLDRITDFDMAEQWALGRMKKKIMGTRHAIENGVGRVVISHSAIDAPLSAALAGQGTIFEADDRNQTIGAEQSS